MSDGRRRGAIYLHRSDVMETMKSSGKTSKENLAAPAPVQRASSSGRMTKRSFVDEMRRSKTAVPPGTPEKPDRRGTCGGGGRRGSLMVEGTAPSYQRRGSCVLPDSGGPRRGSIMPDYSGKRGSIFSGDMAGRRGSSMTGDNMYSRRGSSFGPNRRGSRLDEGFGQPQRRKKQQDEPALTGEQVEAFQEVFDLFDSNGGGTIDADELQSALSSVDIHLPAQDIRDVLEEIDKDGSGEIDFEEFLTLMTNTEKFLETFAASHDEHPEGEEDNVGGRETVLFDALTKFMKTSALKQMDVLERYFNTKYKRAQAPHVVMHYAAGARLIGLTEKQLAQHLDRLQASNEGYDYKSPYAEPLRIMLAPKRKVRKKKKKKIVPVEETIPDERPRLTGKIRIRVHFRSESEEPPPVLENKIEEPLVEQVVEPDTKKEKVVGVPRLGWVRPRVKSIVDRLPKIMNMKTTYTMDDLHTMREKIQIATSDFHHDLAASRHEDHRRFWKTLKTQRMNRSQRLSFKRVFHAYSDAGKHVIA